ncbi:MAG: DUF192 domain-containing protein [Patescibacteria group bacterium]
MNFRKRTIILALCLAVAFSLADLYLSRDRFFASLAQEIPVEKRTALRIGSTLVSAIVADTPAVREHGLSGRALLRENEGMLFVFERPDLYAFWMKDMLFSIDIIWMDTNGRVVDIAANLSPKTYPELFAPREKAQYALEVPAGFAARHRVEIGTLIAIATR